MVCRRRRENESKVVVLEHGRNDSIDNRRGKENQALGFAEVGKYKGTCEGEAGSIRTSRMNDG